MEEEVAICQRLGRQALRIPCGVCHMDMVSILTSEELVGDKVSAPGRLRQGACDSFWKEATVHIGPRAP